MTKKIALLLTVVAIVLMASCDALARGRGGARVVRPVPGRAVRARPYVAPARVMNPPLNRARYYGYGRLPVTRARVGYGVAGRYPYYHRHHRAYYPGWRPGWWTIPVAWGVGATWWNWNTGSYYNPYATYIDNSTYSYSEPVYLDTSEEAAMDEDVGISSTQDGSMSTEAVRAPPSENETSAMRYFESARKAFKEADYNKALQEINLAIRLLPNDAALHEFRGLALFAVGKYNQAAAVINSVLASGPGWDWETMIDLYQDPEQYTKQLRDLEAFAKQHDKDAAAKFLLAYEYLVMGFIDDAKAELEDVVRLQPKDVLAKRILTSLSKTKTEDAPAPPAPK